MVHVRGYELLTNLQNFTQKDIPKVKIFQKVSGGATFFLKHPLYPGFRLVPFSMTLSDA